MRQIKYNSRIKQLQRKYEKREKNSREYQKQLKPLPITNHLPNNLRNYFSSTKEWKEFIIKVLIPNSNKFLITETKRTKRAFSNELTVNPNPNYQSPKTKSNRKELYQELIKGYVEIKKKNGQKQFFENDIKEMLTTYFIRYDGSKCPLTEDVFKKVFISVMKELNLISVKKKGYWVTQTQEDYLREMDLGLDVDITRSKGKKDKVYQREEMLEKGINFD